MKQCRSNDRQLTARVMSWRVTVNGSKSGEGDEMNHAVVSSRDRVMRIGRSICCNVQKRTGWWSQCSEYCKRVEP